MKVSFTIGKCICSGSLHKKLHLVKSYEYSSNGFLKKLISNLVEITNLVGGLLVDAEAKSGRGLEVVVAHTDGLPVEAGDE